LNQNRKPRVVIADDETHIRSLIRIMMKSMNTEVVGEAKNGKEVVELFKKEKPDLLLLDVNMPGKSGTEALREIITDFPEAFVIMLTSVSDRETVEECIDIGASHYILKDTPAMEMKKIIKAAWIDFKQKKETSND